MKDAIRFAVILGAISVVAAIGVAGVYELTQKRINSKEQQSFGAALKEIFPDADRFVPAGSTTAVAGQAGDERFMADFRGGKAVAAAMKGSETVGYLATGEKQGYSSRIKVLVGAKPDFSVKAIRILYAAETPGLGERAKEVKTNRTIWQALWGPKPETIESNEPWFPKQFENKTIGQLEVVKSASTDKIQAITAATVTSGAVTESARYALGLIMKQAGGPSLPADVQAMTSATPSAVQEAPGKASVESSSEIEGTR